MIDGSARGNQNPGEEALSLKDLSKKYPAIKGLLNDLGVPVTKKQSLAFLCEEAGVDHRDVLDILNGKVISEELPSIDVEDLTIIPGKNKSGKSEFKDSITICRGEIIAIVGATGSGKSQLLSDIEGMVQGDSPSGRSIELNKNSIDDDLRLNSFLFIAQISQNMNYLIDLPVSEFLDLHIESRMVKNSKGLKKKVVKEACKLCGEAFELNDKMVSLSGGQARALMIADSIFISDSPIILVDEIENAGIDQEKAIDLLLGKQNITIIATHSPLIALLAHKRIILKNGGIDKIITKTPEEEETLKSLSEMNIFQNNLKEKLRRGDNLR
ncbi:MAG: ATP-binding cassette domain-containing protein [Desulfobacterales bacterium]|nr:ATP-binding cassette domain-containing protein [Desulfobacterales bacterium]MCP4161897.1 ATP-binding cassette domain-containing protein [Deltaproteobacteria bacterium]